MRLEDLEQSTPDPALFARAKHARFDEIDWFISHSWHDSPEAKYSALQAARSTFVAANNREPVVLDGVEDDAMTLHEAAVKF